MKNKPETRNLQITRRAVCILAVCVTVVILGTAGLCLYFVYNKKPVWTQADLTVTQEVLHNPYCGWYQIYGYTLTDESQTAGQNPAWSVLDTKISAAVAQSESANDRLALLQINLKQFADRDLTENALAELKHILTRWEESSCSLILRFLYDWDGNAQSTEPNDISQIEKHMRQCAQILNEHKDNIYLVQGIFIGNYGEMHHSRFSSEEEQIQLFTVLRGSLDDEIYMAVRTPAQLRAVLAADHLDEGQAAVIKTGLFNDGIMASESDLGTYTDRSRELSYQDEVCLTVPNGGEVVSDTVYNDVENAMNTLQTMHVSYLNRMYDEKVLKKWKNQPYEDTTGYDYIGAHLGYRYEISGTAFSYKMFGQTAKLTFSIKNTGFAPAYYDFTTELRICDMEGNIIQTQNLGEQFSTTALQPDSLVTLSCPVFLHIAKGTYQVYLKMSSPKSGEKIRFALTEEPTENGYLCGTFIFE